MLGFSETDGYVSVPALNIQSPMSSGTFPSEIVSMMVQTPNTVWQIYTVGTWLTSGSFDMCSAFLVLCCFKCENFVVHFNVLMHLTCWLRSEWIIPLSICVCVCPSLGKLKTYRYGFAPHCLKFQKITYVFYCTWLRSPSKHRTKKSILLLVNAQNTWLHTIA